MNNDGTLKPIKWHDLFEVVRDTDFLEGSDNKQKVADEFAARVEAFLVFFASTEMGHAKMAMIRAKYPTLEKIGFIPVLDSPSSVNYEDGIGQINLHDSLYLAFIDQASGKPFVKTVEREVLEQIMVFTDPRMCFYKKDHNYPVVEKDEDLGLRDKILLNAIQETDAFVFTYKLTEKLGIRSFVSNMCGAVPDPQNEVNGQFGIKILSTAEGEAEVMDNIDAEKRTRTSERGGRPMFKDPRQTHACLDTPTVH